MQRGALMDSIHEQLKYLSVCDKSVLIRPLVPDDRDFYHQVRLQHSMIYRCACFDSEDQGLNIFLKEALGDNVFFCVIENAENRVPLGFLGIKDLSADVWEIAIELDNRYVHHGIGPRSLRAFLNELYRIIGKSEFKARVDADNIPSQKCLEKTGAKLVGICDGIVLKTDEDKVRFEEQNLILIDNHMREVADRIDIEPRKLLSHVLDYRLTCPLK